MDIFVSKMQGAITRKFTGSTSQNLKVLIVRHPTPSRNTRQLQTPKIMSNFMLHTCQSIHLRSPKNMEISHHETSEKKYTAVIDCVVSDKISKKCTVRSPNIYRKTARTNTEKFRINKTHDSLSG